MAADLDIILKKYKHGRREDLIPLLQEIQAENGYLSEESIVRVGSHLGLSTTKILRSGNILRPVQIYSFRQGSYENMPWYLMFYERLPGYY